MTFTISPAIKQCWPETALGLLLYQVQVAPSSPQLLAQFDQTVACLLYTSSGADPAQAGTGGAAEPADRHWLRHRLSHFLLSLS